MKEELSKRLKKKALDLGADVVGVAGNEGFDQTPEGHRPKDILKGARCVISLGFAQPNTVIQKAMPTQYTRNIFTVASLADQVAHLLTLWIEIQGYEAIPISVRGMYMDALTGELRGDLSHKHTAVLASLGEIRVNTLLIHPEFGNRLMLSSVVTSAPLLQDKAFSEKLCLGKKCLKCVEVCPVKAISANGRIEKIKCAKNSRSHVDIYKETWGLYFCRECRRVCPIGTPTNIKKKK